jgi:hypothetical protein
MAPFQFEYVKIEYFDSVGFEHMALRLSRYIIRPMKIDIMFLVPARMGFICRTKIFHYSLFLKNRLNKTPN